jgi:hypothetical protein
MSGPSGAEVAGWINDALTEIHASANRLPDPVFTCVNGHRLQGQDMPPETQKRCP